MRHDATVHRRTALASGYVAVAVADAVLAGASNPRARKVRYVTKPALMPLLAAAAETPRGITAAQALSWGGDVALLRRGEAAFLTGLGSFFAAHTAYVATFLARRGSREDADRRALAAASALWLTTAPLMTVAAQRKSRKLAAPVAAYGTALVGMFAAASMMDPALPRRARRMVQGGAALFLVSDTLLGTRTFLLEKNVPALDAAVMVTYTAGQGLIAAGTAML